MTRHRTVSALLAAALVFVFGTAFTECDDNASPCDRYVSTSGASDGNSGSSTASPWRHIQHAADVATAGMTVCVDSGTYAERVEFGRGGTASNRVTFQNYPGKTPVIDGTGVSVPDNSGLVTIDGGTDYLSLVGFTIQDSTERGLYNDGAHTIVASNTIQRSANAAIINTAWDDDANFNSYLSNSLLDNVRAQKCWTPTSDCTQTEQWESAINFAHRIGAFGHNTFDGNVIANNHGEGAIVDDFDVYTDNTFHDNFSVDLYIGSHDAVANRNLIYESETSDPSGNNESYRLIPIGVLYAVEGGGTSMQDNQLANNFIINTRIGIRFWKNGHSEVTMTDETIDNNTIVNGWGTGIDLESAGASGTLIRNNIVWPRAGQAATAGLPASGVTLQTNIRRGVEADPNLPGEGTTSHDVNQFKLSAGSSAINAGVNSSVPADYFGTSRPSGAYDVGAHER